MNYEELTEDLFIEIYIEPKKPKLQIGDFFRHNDLGNRILKVDDVAEKKVSVLISEKERTITYELENFYWCSVLGKPFVDLDGKEKKEFVFLDFADRKDLEKVEKNDKKYLYDL
jgi:hypothetical protein